MSVVDDYGRFDARPAILRTACYPLQIDRIREADISRSLSEVKRAGLIALYEVNGKPFLEMLDFRQQVRAKESKWPGKCVADAQRLLSVCEASAHLDEVEVEDECVDECDNTPLKPPKKEGCGYSTNFETFWKAYPRRVAKGAAWKAWIAAEKGETLPTLPVLLDSVARSARTVDWQKNGGQYIPHPATWINRRQWEDEAQPYPASVEATREAAYETGNFYEGVGV
jgi:hypothetical protein